MSQHKDSEPPRCSKTLVKRGRSRQCAVTCVTTYGFLGTLHRERECITHAGSSLSQSTNNCSFLFTSHWPDLNTWYHLTARKARQSQWVDGIFGECSFPGGASGKESACQCKRRRSGFNPWVGEDPLEKKVATRSSILAWWAIVHGVTKASDMTYRLNNNNNNKE